MSESGGFAGATPAQAAGPQKRPYPVWEATTVDVPSVPVEVLQDPDGAWVVRQREMDVMSQGRTRDEALNAGAHAIRAILHILRHEKLQYSRRCERYVEWSEDMVDKFGHHDPPWGTVCRYCSLPTEKHYGGRDCPTTVWIQDVR